jgi:hypothetical protein
LMTLLCIGEKSEKDSLDTTFACEMAIEGVLK